MSCQFKGESKEQHMYKSRLLKCMCTWKTKLALMGEKSQLNL